MEDQFPTEVEAIPYSIQKYEAHTHNHTYSFKQANKRSVLHQDGENSESQVSYSSSELSDDERDPQVNYTPTLFGHHYNHRMNRQYHNPGSNNYHKRYKNNYNNSYIRSRNYNYNNHRLPQYSGDNNNNNNNYNRETQQKRTFACFKCSQPNCSVSRCPLERNQGRIRLNIAVWQSAHKLPDKPLSSQVNLAHEICTPSEHIDELLVAEGLTSMNQQALAQPSTSATQNRETDDQLQ